MILSMTGYGSANIERGDFFCHVEIRSVNNRFLKAAVRVPDEVADTEVEIEKRLRAKLGRGSVNVTVVLRTPATLSAAPVNRQAAESYLQQMLALQRLLPAASQSMASIDLTLLLTLPGVCVPAPQSEAQAQQARELVLEAFDAALNLLVQMRQREGQALWADLQVHLQRIETALENVRTQAPLVARQYHEKLRGRVMQMVGESKLSLDDNDLLREVVLFTDRCDISEELTRMAGHLRQFADTCCDESQAGRKLDFIAQEMLREANTIGSKASDGSIVRSIVDIKGAIDRIKEQIQNVE